MKNSSEIIRDFNLGYNISELESKHGGSRKTLRKILFDAKLIHSIEPTRKKYFEGKNNVEIKSKLLLRYETEKDLLVLSKELNIPVMSIYNLLKKMGVYNNSFGRQLHHDKVRKYPLDEHFFDIIDTEEKAYFLGILYADGTNSINRGEVSLRLQENDVEILKTLNNLIQPSKPVGYIPQKTKKHKNCRRLTINSKKISNKLNEFGMTPNKTFKLTYPTWLDDDLYRHFIRGYFDGDGCVTFNKINQQLCISFTGTDNMMLSIQKILMKSLKFSKTKLSNRFPERNNNTRSLLYFGNGNSRKFYEYLYGDSKIYMVRKKNKFEKHLKLN